MPKLFPRTGALFAAWLALNATSAAAQTPRPDPADAHAKVPSAVARKAMPLPSADDPPRVDWRAANDRVERVGGWRTYARETLPAEKPL
ncbi:hypothetical protein [Roseateles sp. LKC17W]|uniref:Uncharacterized protein n=1 Tax=Pelomonas margarita TaxID=3299031 RepID=A0ABW7FC65_9BURK